MPISGSKAGGYRSSLDTQGYDINVVKQWLAIGNHEITGEDLYRSLVVGAKPIQLEVGIGNTCGLECRHCFLGYSSGVMQSELTPLSVLQEATTTLVETWGTRMVCVADRDALAPLGRSLPYFHHLAGLRQQYADLKFGGITNGLKLPECVSDLQSIQLDYLDISIDGPQVEHDQLRGAGKFEEVLANLRLALRHEVAERIIVATTLSRLNDDATIRLITQLIGEGVQWFDISPLMAVKMPEVQLQADDLAEFLDSLTQVLEPLRPSQSVTILLEVPAYGAAFLPSLVKRGWLKPDEICQDRYSYLYQDMLLNDKITVRLRPELIPEYWRQALRITANGYVVGGCEALTHSQFEQFAIGNICSESISDIYPRAIATSSPFHQMMLAYDRSVCRHKPCFVQCLGGDPLLAQVTYDDYTQKDPNCAWEQYPLTTAFPSTSDSKQSLCNNM